MVGGSGVLPMDKCIEMQYQGIFLGVPQIISHLNVLFQLFYFAVALHLFATPMVLSKSVAFQCMYFLLFLIVFHFFYCFFVF